MIETVQDRYIKRLTPPPPDRTQPIARPSTVPPLPPPRQVRAGKSSSRRAACLMGCALASVTAVVAADAGGPASTVIVAVADDHGHRDAMSASAEAFLSTWVTPDGRVIRRDQGNDTVSEGQAYGLLIAAGSNNPGQFETIWTWTRTHLLRPDGLLAWRWKDGRIIDPEPASDADLDAARALVRAGALFNRKDWTDAGNALARTILDRLTVTTPLGRILLPGQWARTGSSYTYNPSYASPAAFEVLHHSTGDPRWLELEQGTLAATVQLLMAGKLPPDWAVLTADGSLRPSSTPQGPDPQESGQLTHYGYDAARLPIRFAESCQQPAQTGLAAALGPALARHEPLPAELALDGTTIGTDQHPVSYVARAASRASRGEAGQAWEDLDTAEELNAAHPTYYGAAWLALGRALLGSRTLGGCPPLYGR